MTRRAAVMADRGPVVMLAGIATAGSYTHIRDTATGHRQQGWMAWAIAVYVDPTCVMAAQERQRDKRTARRSARLSKAASLKMPGGPGHHRGPGHRRHRPGCP